MADRAQACYGGSISQVNESWGVGSISKGLLVKNRGYTHDPSGQPCHPGCECERLISTVIKRTPDSPCPAATDSEVQPEDLLLGGFLEEGADVHPNAEGKRIEGAVHTAAVSRAQIERARQVVVGSEVDPIVSREAYAPFRRA